MAWFRQMSIGSGVWDDLTHRREGESLDRDRDKMMRCLHRASRGLCRTGAAVVGAFLVFGACQAPTYAQQVGSAVGPPVPEEVPAAHRKLKLDYSQTPVGLQIDLPPAEASVKRSMARKSRNGPLKVGVHRAMPDGFQGDLSPELDWVEMGDGTVVSSVSVTSPGASAMRMGVTVELPEGGELRFFGGQPDQGHDDPDYPVIGGADLVRKNTTSESLGALRAKPGSGGAATTLPAGEALSGLSFSLKDDTPEIVWSPVVKGDTIGVEITLPSPDAQSGFSFGIEKISHIHDPIDPAQYEPRRLDCFTQIDVQCPEARFPKHLADAVASLLFELDDGSYICSGTLLNDTADDTFIPYFLTAHHCVPSQEAARTVEAWWFFRRETCGRVEIDERYTVTYGGGDLLATSLAQDSSLLRLEGPMPAGVSYAGWIADPVRHPAVVYGLHHPDGDEMKYTAGRTLGQGDVDVPDLGTVVNAIIVRWSHGATEGGSSGSGLFEGEHLLGALSAGTPDCEGGTDIYGTFRDFYPQVRRWLDPVWSHDLPLVTAASNLEQQGFVRIVNHSGQAGTVQIYAIDDTGEYLGPVDLSLEAHEAVHFNSEDLETGNPSKGLSAGVGDGSGNWRLELTTELAIDARAYVRTADGFLSSIHEVAAEVAAQNGATNEATDEATDETQDEAADEAEDAMTVRYRVPIFNPADNGNQQSRLRLINPGVEAADIVITGQDDRGEPPPEGEVRLTLAGGAAHMLSAQALEAGGDDVEGRFGDGTGKWRLTVSADQPILVMSLMLSPTGHLTNLSR